MRANNYKYVVATVLVLTIGLMTACSGGDSTSASSSLATTPPAPTPTPMVLPPTAEPSATPAPIATTVPTEVAVGEPSLDEKIADGKVIYEKTAGGVGCALCHGMDALGDLSQAAPPNIGASVELIEEALDTKPQMSFISLTRDEAKAVSTYLVWLQEQQ